MMPAITAVIPGHREAMSPESILHAALVARWIPGSRCARPGMTVAVMGSGHNRPNTIG